jgi:hypothetical protein
MTDKDAFCVVVSISAMDAVMKRHNLQPDKDGNVEVTLEMIAEAEALDRARKNALGNR